MEAILTKKQEVVYNYIKKFIKRNGYSPSIREIGKGVGLTAPATIHTHLNNLRDLKVINFTDKKARTIRIL